MDATQPTSSVTPPANPLGTPDPSANIKAVADDGLATVQEALKLYAAFKAKGLPGVIALTSEVAPIISKDVKDVIAAKGELASGFKSSEWWMGILGYGAIGYCQMKGIPLSPWLIGGFSASHIVFTLVRSGLKQTVAKS